MSASPGIVAYSIIDTTFEIGIMGYPHTYSQSISGGEYHIPRKRRFLGSERFYRLPSFFRRESVTRLVYPDRLFSDHTSLEHLEVSDPQVPAVSVIKASSCAVLQPCPRNPLPFFVASVFAVDPPCTMYIHDELPLRAPFAIKTPPSAGVIITEGRRL